MEKLKKKIKMKTTFLHGKCAVFRGLEKAFHVHQSLVSVYQSAKAYSTK